jgi:ribosomal protein S18 acetylase RimI-like enzyme
MVIDDYSEVYNLWLSCKGMGLNNLDDSKKGIDRLLKRNPNTCFVYIEDDKIVGVILGSHDGRRGHINHLAVLEEYRNNGIATKLLDKTINAFDKEGITKVNLVNFKGNDVANEFWEKKNFKVRNDLYYRDYIIKEMIRHDT